MAKSSSIIMLFVFFIRNPLITKLEGKNQGTKHLHLGMKNLQIHLTFEMHATHDNFSRRITLVAY